MPPVCRKTVRAILPSACRLGLTKSTLFLTHQNFARAIEDKQARYP